MIIREGGRPAAAACVMPLTAAFLSTASSVCAARAAIGVTEDTDAVASSSPRSVSHPADLAWAHYPRYRRQAVPESILRAFLMPRQRKGNGVFSLGKRQSFDVR